MCQLLLLRSSSGLYIEFNFSNLNFLTSTEGDDKCDRCAQSPADLTHMFWSCPKLISFWSFYFEIISKSNWVEVLPGVGIAIYGVPKSAKSFISR